MLHFYMQTVLLISQLHVDVLTLSLPVFLMGELFSQTSSHTHFHCLEIHSCLPGEQCVLNVSRDPPAVSHLLFSFNFFPVDAGSCCFIS